MLSSLSQKLQITQAQKIRLSLHHKPSLSPNLICKHKKLQVQYQKKYQVAKVLPNKKVLLRERKRHTARRIASTRCAALSNPDLVGGVPGPMSGGDTQSQVWREYPDPGPGGYLVPGLGGTQSQVQGNNLSQVWGGTPGTPPDLGWGTPLPRPGMGYPLPRPGMGYPPPASVDRLKI